MKKYNWLLLLVVLFSVNTFACLNGETKILKNGEFIYEDYQGIYPHGHTFYIDNFPKLIAELDRLYAKTKDLDYLSDKGYVLTIQKKYDEALKLYLEIEKKQPNRYSTASNVGTLYELIGQNQKAYDWIKKAIKINPKSHSSSEWLHLKILEAKIKGDSYITADFLINTNFGNDTIPKTKLNKKELESLSKALYYQLNERVTFIKPKDKIIATLLYQLGNVAYLKGENYNSNQIYKLAKSYGYTDEMLFNRLELNYDIILQNDSEKSEKSIVRLEKKIQELSSSDTAKKYNQIKYYLFLVSILSLLLFVALIVFINKWRKEKNKNVRD